ncbi:MAG: HNH endonuclease signature motif containing protein [Termitinemataceae bacterium]|nr:MAG: HNH endonuclease signature motif containing protein [Termitinemataceae bacterium]
MNGHRYTTAEIRFLKKKAPGRSFDELATMFNKYFSHRLKHSAVIQTCSRYGITNGRDCRFHAGQTVWNKGMKGWSAPGTEKTRFKKGNRPANHRPIGSERINSDGYVQIKVAEPNKWKMKSVMVWEKENGKLPKGMIIIFADGNKLNLGLDNFLVISRRELAVMNHLKLISINGDLTKIGKKVANIHMLMADRRRELKKQKGEGRKRSKKQ